MSAAAPRAAVRHRKPGGLLLLILLLGLAAVQPAPADDLLLYDESVATQFSQLQRVYEDPAAAHTGAVGLRLEPTYWHNQFMRLAAGRTDFRPYSTLEFAIRAASGSVDPQFRAWDLTEGRWVRVADYVDGGIIDTQWRIARIPVPDLASDSFALDTVYLIGFAPSPTPAPFYVDDMVLRDATRPAVAGWSMPSGRVVTVRLANLDLDAVPAAAAVSVHSDTDPAFATPLPAAALGLDRSAVDVTDTGMAAVVEARLHLLLPTGLMAGHDYQLDLSALRAPSGLAPEQPLLTVGFDPAAVSASIKVNQVGYQPAATKLGFVGNWLGDLGPMPVDGFLFDVIDTADGCVVLTGELLLRAAADPNSGEDVYTADFSALTTPGRYRLAVPGLGLSHPFDIADDVYDSVYRTTARVFYHKRNTTLSAAHADPGFARAGIDPLLDAVFHPVLADYPLSRGEEPFAVRPVTGGWFDAGDYGHYMHNAAPVWATIGAAFDLAPAGHFGDGELDIPESGNGLPDLLDELGFGMRWALSMQDDDGGVYWRVTSGNWDLGLPADVSEPRFLYEKTTRATAQLAAMGAIYARLIDAYDEADANAVLAAALRAWDYATTQPVWPPEGTHYQNPAEYPGGGTYSSNTAKPDLLWAAAELYRTTGEARFQDAYRGLDAETGVDLSAAPFSTWAAWAFIGAEHDGRDVLLLEQARRSIMVAADIRLNRAADSAYRSAKHPYIPFTGWYNFSVSPIAALALLQAHHLSGEPAYLDAATQGLDIILGANPQSRSYLTGIGAAPVRDPMDRISLNDANPEPLAGLTVAGPTWHLPAYRQPYAAVNEAWWPPSAPAVAGDYAGTYPVLRRWIDDHQLIPMSESTVREWAPVAVVFGLLRDAASPPQPAPAPYAWSPGSGGSTTIYRLGDIPVADVPDLTPAQIAAFGSEVTTASDAHIAALTPAQVAAIDAPDTHYWVQRLSPEQRLALTAGQIAAFNVWSLFTPLPPAQVPLIPPAKMPVVGVELRDTPDAWKAAVTPEQRAAMTAEQQLIMTQAGY
jgi:endoglucanase